MPLLIITPLTFLGGASIRSTCCRRSAEGHAVQSGRYLISGFRWSFYGLSDVSLTLSLAMTLVFMACARDRRVDSSRRVIG